MTDRSGFGLTVLTPEQQVAAILAQDARRVRRLTWLTVGLWVLTVLLTGLLIFGFQLMYQFASHTVSVYEYQRERIPVKEMTPEQLALARAISMNAQVTFAGRLLAAAVALLALSALGTMLLVHASRRATLRQIQVSLADISAQLADLRQRTATGPLPPGNGSA
jgi:hypothetical protein